MTLPSTDTLGSRFAGSDRGGIGFASVRNADADWDKFAPDWYRDQNYASVRADDRLILEYVRDFFARSNVAAGRGVDAGAGANLYPAMSMLPFCREITLLDISAANVAWLRAEIQKPALTWDDFYALLSKRAPYAALPNYRASLKRAARVVHGSMMDLAPNQFDIGTMFFAAESLTTDLDEFQLAVHAFVRSLKDGAPFAIAFMSGSEGYEIDGIHFPAVAINQDDVQHSLKAVASLESIHDIPSIHPFREGYEGMLLAVGFAAHGTRDGEIGNENRTSVEPAGDLARRRGLVLPG